MSAPVDYGSLGFKDLLVKLDGAVVVATLNRTAQRNTFTHTLCRELITAFDIFDRDDRVRVVVLTADPAAPAFCSGADISSGWNGLWDKESEREGAKAHRDTGGQYTLSVLRCRKVTIIAVNGHGAGIGMTMQLAFDIRFAWAEARLSFPFVQRGIAPEALSTYLLPRLIGHSRASSLMLTGQSFAPTHAYLSPLYHAILPSRTEVFPAAIALARQIASTTSAPAIALTKALLWRGADTPEAQHLIESLTIRALATSKDGEEGARSFLEKRRPVFEGTLAELPEYVPWWIEPSVVHRKTKL